MSTLHYASRWPPEPHQCERCGNDLNADEDGRDPNPLIGGKYLLLCDRCEKALLEPQQPKPKRIKVKILKLLVTPWEVLRVGEVHTVYLLKESSSGIKVKLEGGREKFFYANEFKRVK